ncbi:MAG: glycogen synthase, partial [Candidatus Limnocylindria bacterium]
MRALILTNEFPPEIYGGAGVHVDELTRHLRALIGLDVRTFGSRSEEADGWRVRGYQTVHDLGHADARLSPMLSALSRGVGMVVDPVDA